MIGPDERAPSGRWTGLTVLLTGATGGIGRATAKRLASEGATLLLHARSRPRLDALAKELRDSGAQVTPLVCDLTSLSETAGLARAALEVAPRLDVLVNNAGVGFGQDKTVRETSRDGFELRFAVNYLAPFVLTEELLARGAPSRAIVNVASAGQEALDLDDLMTERGYDGVRAYRRSKLAMVMYTFDLAGKHTSVASNALHPGTFLDTGMVRDAGIAPLGPAEGGADVIAHVLRAALEDETSGRYYFETRPSRAEEQAYDLEARRVLRERTLEITRPFRAARRP